MKKEIINSILVLVLLLTVNGCVFWPHSVRLQEARFGTVIDKKSKQPIQNVLIVDPDNEQITKTCSEGKFYLDEINDFRWFKTLGNCNVPMNEMYIVHKDYKTQTISSWEIIHKTQKDFGSPYIIKLEKIDNKTLEQNSDDQIVPQ